ncbi:sodium:solute symporter family protein [Pectobacterium quasiaquaticum]|uniref:Sodium:solute symporter family protein n=1 Tax=Pectobacterium quasiaquaticum TaxID=2774015 RepID=A0A9Q2ERD3_9GAMM|nr:MULTISPECIES: sodium:solute symporter family protein [Pectobacterium]MBE5204169.1 sodium:solute symporter family protein [Pectobacterium quasiaquaticum]MBE5210374.1 sodium:solute symporter family protein [Pectobacterium quasiaquaticum]MBE5215135.1 sodium:solute symporter family protein [Pectobacterium quasiaquaticum]MBE5221916.1 sodium:solute symporter family protein [Pectobacterium quasiaquaticum]MBE5224563.1 sodium:solute symporter family protein [Pectobacterium quasiaquaticum]
MNHFDFTDTLIIIGMIVFYIAFTSWLTLKLRSKSNAEFMEGSRALPAFIVGVLLMTEFIGAKSTVGTAQSAFENGIAASWSVIGAAIGFLLFGMILVKKIYNTGKLTISGAIAEKYGTSTKNIISIIMIYALLLVNVGNYVSGAAAISTVLKISLPVAALITAIVSTFYFYFGGLKGVAYVTLIHSAIKYIGVMIILYVALKMTGGITPMIEKMPDYYWTWDGNIGASTIFAWLIGTIGSIFCTQFVIQAISSTSSAKSAKRATWVAFFFCMPIAIAIAVIGVAAKFAHPEIKSLYAMPIFLQDMNPWVAGLVTTSLVASIFISVSTVALAIASLIVKDFYVPYYNPTPEKEMKMTRVFSLIIGFLPLIFVLLVPEVLKLSFFTRAIRLSISVVAIIAFYLPFFNSTRGANASLISACVVTSVWYILGNPYGIDNMYVALATPAIVMLIDRMIPNKATKIKISQTENKSGA